MKRLMLAAIIIAVALFFILPACGGSNGSGGSSHDLLGVWQGLDINGMPLETDTVILVFSADGTGAGAAWGETESFVWSLDGNQLIITRDGESETKILKWISSDKLEASYGEDTVTFIRS